jgi:hypothetical protein
MNGVTMKELKSVVERAVQPVRATIARKRTMREELLGHLASIFEEESQRLGDEQAAVAQAQRRFGDPVELTKQLQQAVPRWNWWCSILENLGCRPDESAWLLAGKHLLVLLLFYLFFLPAWMLTVGQFRNPGSEDVGNMLAIVLAGAMLVTAMFNAILSLISVPLLSRFAPVLASSRRGRIWLVALCGFVVLCGLTMPVFAGAALLFTLMARQAVKQWRYETEWVDGSALR